MAQEEAQKAGAMESAPSALASATIAAVGALGLVIARKGIAGGESNGTDTRPSARPATSAVDGQANLSLPVSTLFSNPELPPSSSRNSAPKRNSSFRAFRRRKNSEVPDLDGEFTRERKESVSTRRPSWIQRRLSSVPNSQISSPRSSIAPDSPSFSNGSAAPILSNNSSPTELPPNKLVKRPISRQFFSGSPSSDKELGHSLSLRRPATSHQRSATLLQFKFDGAVTTYNEPLLQQSIQELPDLKSKQFHWSHFVSRGNLQSSDTTKRIYADPNSEAYLVTANMITSNQVGTTIAGDHMHESGVQTAMLSSNENSPVSDISISREQRRSVGGYSSPPPFKSVRSRVIGRRKRQSVEISDSDRNAPGPATTATRIPQHQTIAEQPVSEKQLIVSPDDKDPSLLSNTLSRPARKRNTSSPLPPLTRTSSFALDLSQIGSPLSSPSSPPLGISMHQNNIVPMHHPVPNQSTEFGSSPPISATQTRTYRAPEVAPSDRTYTLVGSDNEIRGFYSGEDEDTDFDTIFDSFRTGTTGTTGSLRRENNLESMFDTSPTSSMSQDKLTLRRNRESHPSGHEDFSSSEDEFAPTPIKNGQSYEDGSPTSKETHREISPGHDSQMSTVGGISGIEDFGRLSLEDDDDDEDWARDFDDIGVTNSLSPPSSSLSSRHVSTKSRTPLAELKNAASNRSLQRLYEYSESQAEKIQYDDLPARPKTEHGLQTNRKSPSLLLRTHSVPVAGDDIHSATVGPCKMKMTEEWDDDFFTEVQDFGKVMPAALQASQEQVRGNSGLIREFKSNVEDLKRLRNATKGNNMFNGPYASLWVEAAGIINLASPDDPEHSSDEKDQSTSPSVSPTTIDFDHDAVDAQFRDCGFDGEELDHPDDILDGKLDDSGVVADTTTVRRRSVFLPEDEIFGHSADVNVNTEVSGPLSYHGDLSDKSPTTKPSKGATFPRIHGKDAAAFARSVMETMQQHRSISDPVHSESQKMMFDQTHLRELVTRSNFLIKTLGEVVTAAENASQSPQRTPQRSPHHSPQRIESPAFTRVFTDPLASPPRRLSRTKSAISGIGGSPDSSPTKSHSNRIHMMRVN